MHALRWLPLLPACTLSVVPTADTPAPSTWVGGQLRLIVDGAPRGPTFLFRYDCDDPPPPAGSGRPRDFLVVPAGDWDGDRADFAFPTVPPGTCALVTGFVDRDEDFDVATTVTTQATAGDLAFGAVVAQVGEEVDGNVAPVSDLELRAETEVPWERPAFVAVDATTGAAPVLPLGETPGTTPMMTLALSATDVLTPLLDVDPSTFTVVLGPDGDGDGLPDDANADGSPDILWPRVLVRRLDPADPTGLSALEPNLVLPGVVLAANPQDPGNPATNLLMQAAMAGVPADGQSVLLTRGLLVVVPPLIVTSQVPLELTPIESVAASGAPVRGPWQILVMNVSGQLWTVPNELGAMGLPEQGAGFLVE